jgi:penicillin-insensitive murein endopeptidase
MVMFIRYYAVPYFAALFFSSFLIISPVMAFERPAKELFGYTLGPAKMKPRPIGTYNRGCLAGARKLPATGSAWQAMRLSRNRNWGHPVLVDFIRELAIEAKKHDGWPGLLVGDMSQPRGGPMLTGHRSHQIGLDTDIWLTPMPDHRQSYSERETRAAISMLARGGMSVNPKRWSDSRARLIRRAASDRRVARIFVHPAIKKALCEFADRTGGDRSWLRRVRPWWGHHYHFHVRLRCARGMSGCRNQAEPPPGDGCGKQLTQWFNMMRPKKVKKPAPKTNKKRKKRRKRRPLTLASLPVACSSVIAWGGGKGRMRRFRYGVAGKIPAPLRNPQRGAGPNLAWRLAHERQASAVQPGGVLVKTDLRPSAGETSVLKASSSGGSDILGSFIRKLGKKGAAVGGKEGSPVPAAANGAASAILNK